MVQAVGSNLTLDEAGRLDIKPRTPFKLIQDRIIATKRIVLSNRLSDSPTPLLRSALYPLPNDIRTYYVAAKATEIVQMREWFNFLQIPS